MMRTSHRHGGPRAGRPEVEPLEGRSLLSTMVLHSPEGSPPVQVAASSPTAPASLPRVAFAQFEPLTGRVLVQFSGDPAGYDPAVLTDPANYGFRPISSTSKAPSPDPSRPGAGVVLAPNYRVTGVSLATPTPPGSPPTVIVTIDNNQPLRPGSYRFSIRSAGLVDLAGRPLDGAYSGTFPSGGGGGPGGGDFAAILVETHSTILPAQPTPAQHGPVAPSGVVPTYVFLPSTTAVRVRYAAAKPGKFMLAGGNNITLIPLQHQDFPGTYRPSKPAHPSTPGASKAGKHR